MIRRMIWFEPPNEHKHAPMIQADLRSVILMISCNFFLFIYLAWKHFKVISSPRSPEISGSSKSSISSKSPPSYRHNPVIEPPKPVEVAQTPEPISPPKINVMGELKLSVRNACKVCDKSLFVCIKMSKNDTIQVSEKIQGKLSYFCSWQQALCWHFFGNAT